MVSAYYSGTIKEFLENFKNAEQFVENMKKQHSGKNERQEKAWKESYEHIRKLFELLSQRGYGDIHCFFEYVLPGIGKRIDVVFMGKETENIQDKSQDNFRLIIFELKGWDDPGKVIIDSINQLKDYIEKLKHFHSFPQKYKCNFTGILWFYNSSSFKGSSNFYELKQKTTERESNFYICYGECYEKLVEELSKLLSNCPIERLVVEDFTKGSYAQSPELLDMISGGLLNMLTCGISALASIGYSPTEEQMEILEEVMKSFEKGEEKCFIIKGGPGSGKTYLAVLMAIEAIRRSWKLGSSNENLVAIAYKNAKIVKTFREIFKFLGNFHQISSVDAFINYYSSRGSGVLDQPKNSFRLLVCDEAQRISMVDGKSNVDAIKRAMKISKVCVFFYDEGQILQEEEEGTRQNFIDAAKELGIEYKEFELTGSYRIIAGKEYHDFVENFLNGKVNEQITGFNNYELYLFDDIEKMILELVDKKKKKHKVAIVASFTESSGNNKKAFGPGNLRAGKGISALYDVYKNTDIKVYWLTDEEYPKYWTDNPEEMILDREKRARCASVYGCQGFEADYVGVIWGRDMVWDNGWTLGENCEDDVAFKGRSLKDLFNLKDDEEAKETALRLLKNRYRIFLTRGIRGTYIFCEDRKTRDYLSKIIPRFNKESH